MASLTGRLAAMVVGAGLAAAVIWAWRSGPDNPDDALLLAVLQDVCIPYAQADRLPDPALVTPIPLSDLIVTTGGPARDAVGAARMADGRFELVWGQTMGNAAPSRYCIATPLSVAPAPVGFAVRPDGFVAWVTAELAGLGLVADRDAVDDVLGTVSWTRPGDGPQTGLRISMVAHRGLVTFVLVADDGA